MRTAADRRSAPRARFSGIAFLRTERNEVPCVAGDVSEDGMLLYPQRQAPARIGYRMRVVFTLPRAAGWLELPARLVRQGSGQRRTAWAIRFEKVPLAVRHQLREFVCGISVDSQGSQLVPTRVNVLLPVDRPMKADCHTDDEPTRRAMPPAARRRDGEEPARRDTPSAGRPPPGEPTRRVDAGGARARCAGRVDREATRQASVDEILRDEGEQLRPPRRPR